MKATHKPSICTTLAIAACASDSTAAASRQDPPNIAEVSQMQAAHSTGALQPPTRTCQQHDATVELLRHAHGKGASAAPTSTQ